MSRLVRRGSALLLLATGACVVVVDPQQLTEGCGADAKACGDRCVSLQNPKTGCASDECAPCIIQHATARCDAAGRCVKGTCEPYWADCNGEGENDGCETDLDHNPEHCGECDHACPPLPHALPGCKAGECSIDRCESGYGDCDRDQETGCEVDVTSNSEHCGGCNEACATGEDCVEGVCVEPT